MDAFEKVIEQILRSKGYWTVTSFKVELSKDDKVAIGRHSSPRWEIDVVAYKPATNELLAVECKSYLDSKGVHFVDGRLEPPERYKLFTEEVLRRVVFDRLAAQLCEKGFCASKPNVRLCLAIGKVASRTDRDAMQRHFDSHEWKLMDDRWIRDELRSCADSGYENEVAVVVAKILLKNCDEES